MPEPKAPELAGIAVDFACGGRTTPETGRLLGVAAMVVETARREPLDTEAELRFRPTPDSPLIVARGVVAAHLSENALRVHFTHLSEDHRRHLLGLLFPRGDERRAARRASLVTQIRTIVDGETVVGYTRDVSTGGVFIETENPPVKGTEVNLRFRLTPDSPIVGARAVVAYSLPGEGMGLRFVDLTPELQQAIEAFVAGG
ncbi:MAG TPA: PilZ domain-containing protein [Candidatus Acidoferrales bacterium]|nr:PilZ domain-containing protein [Candidatus Acidoferrales bacterium]